jgi:hypothetical protein
VVKDASEQLLAGDKAGVKPFTMQDEFPDWYEGNEFIADDDDESQDTIGVAVESAA